MNNWFEISQHLAVTIMVLLFFFVLVLLLFDGLRSLIHNLRSWLARKTRSPEVEAVDAIDHYQGAFNLNKAGVVRQRYARRLDPKFTNHWGCQGKWKPYE